MLKVFVSYHSNQIYQYKYELNQTAEVKEMPT